MRISDEWETLSTLGNVFIREGAARVTLHLMMTSIQKSCQKYNTKKNLNIICTWYSVKAPTSLERVGKYSDTSHLTPYTSHLLNDFHWLLPAPPDPFLPFHLRIGDTDNTLTSHTELIKMQCRPSVMDVSLVLTIYPSQRGVRARSVVISGSVGLRLSRRRLPLPAFLTDGQGPGLHTLYIRYIILWYIMR